MKKGIFPGLPRNLPRQRHPIRLIVATLIIALIGLAFIFWKVPTSTPPQLFLSNDQLKSIYDASPKRVAFVSPTFTLAAYNNAFYVFYAKYASTPGPITTDLNLLTSYVGNFPSGLSPAPMEAYFKSSSWQTSAGLMPFPITYITDVDIHSGNIFTQTGANAYDVLIFDHAEYMTQQGYDNLKKFVSQGGRQVELDGDTLAVLVSYSQATNSVTLVSGHHWQYNAAQGVVNPGVSEYFATANTAFIGSNFLQTSNPVTFNNNPFGYVHWEENYITNNNAQVLYDYGCNVAQVAAYKFVYGNGSTIHFGLFADHLVNAPNAQFTQFINGLLARALSG